MGAIMENNNGDEVEGGERRMTKRKWTKGKDFIDNTDRWSIDGRDPSSTLEPISVCITSEREREYPSGPMVTRYYGNVAYRPTEYADNLGPFRSVKVAKAETEKLFSEYLAKFEPIIV